MVLHDCDRNEILSDTLKYRAESDILQSLTALYKHVTDRGLQSRLHMLYNECSAGMENFIHSAGNQNQLVPPGLHPALIAEREIQTFKNHFISGLSSCDPKLPLHLLCPLIQQVVLTIKLLRPDKLNPQISAEAAALNFNLTPLLTPRIKVLIFERPGDRRTFDHQVVEGW